MKARARLVESRQSGRAPRSWALGAALPLLTLVTALLSLGIGRYGVAPAHVVGILLSHVWPLAPSWSETEARVVELVRLPRILLACLVGGGLALAGATLQGLFRNPLVSAHILGVSSGAAFGGVLAMVLALGTLLIVPSAMLFGLLALAVVFVMGRVGGRAPVLMLVLSGVITGAFFTAGVSILTYLSDPYNALPAIVFWLMGSLAAASYAKVAILGVPVLLGGGLLLALRWRVNVLSLGDEEARALGLRVEPLRWLCLVATAAIVAGAVAVSGVIGWVGLVIPHVARMLVGPDHRALLPASFLLGASYLTIVDGLARSLTPAEIPLGILTALIGAPVFFALLRRTQGRGWDLD